jgi:hypothetical protein
MKKNLFPLVLIMFLSLFSFAQIQKGGDIDGEATEDYSGHSVSMPDVYTVAIGAYGNDENGIGSGHVRIYSWIGGSWIQKGGDIDGETTLDASGYSVSMPDANTVAIGAKMNDGNGGVGFDVGHVRIYSWNGTIWIQKGGDIDGEVSGDDSGYSVSMPDANTVAIGAPSNDGNGSSSGQVRIYSWNGSTWIQKGGDIDGKNLGYTGDFSGCSVSMPDANTVAIGAYLAYTTYPAGGISNNGPGCVRIYNWNGSAWVQKGVDILGEAATDLSGWSVSMPDANTVAIGAPGNAGNGNASGHVRIYNWNGTTWIQKGVDIDGEGSGDWSGCSVSMPDANTVAIGALWNDGNGNSSGHVRICTWNGTAWVQKGVDIDGEAISDRSGGSVSMPNVNTVAIGAIANDENGIFSGHVQVYGICEGKDQVDFQVVCGSYTWIDGVTYTESIKGPKVSQVDANGCAYDLILNLTIIPQGTGIREWIKTAGNTGSEFSESVVSDIDGSVYVVGSFSGTVDFDPGVGSFQLTASGNTDLFVQKLDAAGNFIWAKHIGGIGANIRTNRGKTIALDSHGDVYIGGHFDKTVDFDPNGGGSQLSAIGTSVDAFILKLRANGNFLWAKAFGGVGRDQVNSITIDAQDNVCTTGNFYKTVDFDPGVGTYMLTATSSQGIFVSKLNSNGNFIWAKKVSGDDPIQAFSIGTNEANDIYITGSFEGTADFDPGSGVVNLTSSSSNNSTSDAYLLKLDMNGVYQWVKQVKGSSYVSGHALTVNPAGDIYMTGEFLQTANFDLPWGVISLLSVGSRDIFITKVSASGDFIWVRQFGDSATDLPFGIATDLEGNVYTTGYFSQKVDFNSGDPSGILTAQSYDVFVLKLDKNGSDEWVHQFGGEGKDIGWGIHVDLDGSVYVAGQFEKAAYFSSGLGGPGVVSNGLEDAFVFKLSQCGLEFNQPKPRMSVKNLLDFNTEIQDVIIYPNPTTGQFTVDLGESMSVELRIYNSLGQMIKVQEYNKSLIELSLEGPAGIYYVEIKGKDNFTSKLKVIKQ